MSMNPMSQLKFAKFIAPSIFENATPKLHLSILNFMNIKHQFKAAVVFRGAGKSTLLNKTHIVNRIFFKHEKFTMIVSENERKAKSFLRDIKRMIDDASEKRLDIRRGDIWNEKMVEVVVDASNPIYAHLPEKKRGVRCAVTAYGAGEDPRGYLYENSRPTFIIADDIESRELVRNQIQREKLAEWFFQDLKPALHPDGEMIIIGTIMHAEQLLSKILNNPAWIHIVLGCYDEDGESRWQSRFPKQKLELIRKELEDQGLFNAFPNEYLCIPQSEERQLFKREFFQYFDGVKYEEHSEKLEFKNATSDLHVEIKTPLGIMLDGELIPYKDLLVYSTMDLASDGKDRTCIVTKGYDSKGREFMLDISSGHWNPFEKSIHSLRVQKQFKPIRFGIEKAGAQNDFFYTIDVAQKEYGVFIPVEELRHGGVNKNIRIANLHPSYTTKKIYHNRMDPNTALMEAQLGSFIIDIQSSEDDIIDAHAYQLQFVQGRSFELQYEEDDEYLMGAYY